MEVWEGVVLLFFISFIAGYILSGVSLFTSTAISLDRLLSLLLGLKYKLVVTLKRARFIVTIIWIVGVVCSALYLWNDQIPLAYAYVCTWICLVISVFFYTTIFVTLRYRQTQVQDLINQHANPTSPMNTAPEEKSSVQCTLATDNLSVLLPATRNHVGFAASH